MVKMPRPVRGLMYGSDRWFKNVRKGTGLLGPFRHKPKQGQSLSPEQLAHNATPIRATFRNMIGWGPGQRQQAIVNALKAHQASGAGISLGSTVARSVLPFMRWAGNAQAGEIGTHYGQEPQQSLMRTAYDPSNPSDFDDAKKALVQGEGITPPGYWSKVRPFQGGILAKGVADYESQRQWYQIASREGVLDDNLRRQLGEEE